MDGPASLRVNGFCLNYTASSHQAHGRPLPCTHVNGFTSLYCLESSSSWTASTPAHVTGTRIVLPRVIKLMRRPGFPAHVTGLCHKFYCLSHQGSDQCSPVLCCVLRLDPVHASVYVPRDAPTVRIRFLILCVLRNGCSVLLQCHELI
jgi:hypothetical protein